ncbi:hypothetical protein ACIQW7_10420 [Peribacillus simplex]|uniref:hypothetical protein n=1 Tax=Peribacillus simplex TaxID=1478 RepID=UPI0038277F36
MKDFLFKKKYGFEFYIYLLIIIFSILALALGKDLLLLGNLMVIFAIVSFLLLKNKKLLLLSTVFVSLIFGGIPFLNGSYIVMYLYILMLVTLLINKDKIKLDKTVVLIAFITIVFNLLPILSYGITVPLLILSILKRFGFLIVYIFTINMINLTDKFKNLLIKLVFITLIINFFVALTQFAKGGLHQDSITGFFGNGMTGIVIYLFMFSIAICSGLHYEKKISTLFYLILILISVIYSAIAEVKIGFISTAVLLIVYLGFINKNMKSIVSLTICGFIFVTFYSVFLNLYPNQNFLDKNFLESYLVQQDYGTGGTINRFNFKPQIDNLIFNNNVDTLLGKGLGSGNPSEVESLKGILNNQFDYLKFTWFTIPYLYVETGIVGAFLYILIYILPLIVAIKHFIKNRTSLSVIVILMGLTNLFYLTYNAGLMNYGVSTIYWIFVAFLVREKKELRIKKV